MPIIIPSPDFLKKRKNLDFKNIDEKKIYLIIKKEYNEDQIKELVNDLKFLENNFLYHEIYIRKGKDIYVPFEVIHGKKGFAEYNKVIEKYKISLDKKNHIISIIDRLFRILYLLERSNIPKEISNSYKERIYRMINKLLEIEKKL